MEAKFLIERQIEKRKCKRATGGRHIKTTMF